MQTFKQQGGLGISPRTLDSPWTLEIPSRSWLLGSGSVVKEQATRVGHEDDSNSLIESYSRKPNSFWVSGPQFVRLPGPSPCPPSFSSTSLAGLAGSLVLES